MGSHLRVLRESYPMNRTLQGLDGFKKSSFLWTKVASALEELSLTLLLLVAKLFYEIMQMS